MTGYEIQTFSNIDDLLAGIVEIDTDQFEIIQVVPLPYWRRDISQSNRSIEYEYMVILKSIETL